MRPALFKTKGSDIEIISTSPNAIYIAKRTDGTVWLGSSYENSLVIELDMPFDEACREHRNAMRDWYPPDNDEDDDELY